MKTITKTIDIYELHELEEEAKNRALEDWRVGNYYFFLESHLYNLLKEKLDENNIKYIDNNCKTKDGLCLLYSLSHSQGDGLCFTGTFEYRDITVYVTHNFRYYHSQSTTIEAQETNNLGYHIDESEPLYQQEKIFRGIYESICKDLEVQGYDFIEYEDSMENFAECCMSNNYTFTKDGEMINE
jgi:hypothetical protein